LLAVANGRVTIRDTRKQATSTYTKFGARLRTAPPLGGVLIAMP
jgi:hypothetical protein